MFARLLFPPKLSGIFKTKSDLIDTKFIKKAPPPMLGKMLMLERFIILILTQGDVREIIRGGGGGGGGFGI